MSYYQYQGVPGGASTYETGYYGYGGYPLEQRPQSWRAEEPVGRGLDYGRSYDVGTTLGNIPTEERLSLGGMEMWQPKCVALATNEGMLLEASLPGVKREDIDLRIINGELILSGKRKEEQLSQKFRRRLWLPQGTQMNQLKASFKDGVLHVLVPLPGRGRMGEGERREMMEEKQPYQERQTYQEWGGTQQQQQYAGGATAQRGEEGGPIPEAGTKEETKPLLEHETRPLSTERETKPLLQKEKEKETEERPSGIFIGGGEAATTGPSSV